MINFIDGGLEPVLWFVADWSLRWAALITLLAAWLAIVRPRRSATRYLLCLLVLLGGLALPVLPRWGAGFAIELARAGVPITVPVEPTPADQLLRSGEPVVLEDLPGVQRAVPTALQGASNDGPARAIEPPHAAESLGLRRLAVLSLVVFWTLGVGFLFARRLGGWLILERLRRTAIPIQGAPSQLLQECRAQLALGRRAALASHPAVRSPITLGLHRPMILVPPNWTELPEPAQRGSLLHELAHLARYDDWLALALEWIRIVFFFHPLVRWLLGRVEYERELLCDETALAQGIDPRDYANVLLEFSRQGGRLRTVFVSPSYPLGFGQRRTVKARINRILEANMNRWMSPLPIGRALALSTIALALALGLGSIRFVVSAAADFSQPQTAGEDGPLQKDRVSKPEVAPAADPRDGPNPNENYRIEPYHVLEISVVRADPGNPIAGNFLVEPAGKIDLGPAYGKLAVTGLTLEDAEAAIRKFLQDRGLKQPLVSVSLAGWVTRWLDDPGLKAPYHVKPLHLMKVRVSGTDPNQPLGGEFLIEPSGKINLGPSYGRVALGGLTLEEAQEAVEKHLKNLGYRLPKVSVTLAGWESDWHDLRKQGTRRNEPLPKPGSRGESLSYGDKSFNEWRAVLMTDLKPEVRIEAIKALSTFGANGYGKEAADAIIEVMRGYDVTLGVEDWKVIEAAPPALTRIGQLAVAALADELKKGSLSGRRIAILTLTQMGRNEQAVPAIIEAVNSDDLYTRRTALVGIERINPDPKLLAPGLPAFIIALKDGDRSVRIYAARALRRMGQDAKPAVGALLAAYQHQENDGDSRVEALWALQRIGAKVDEVLPTLIIMTKDKNSGLRDAAFKYLEALGPSAREAVPALIAAFNENPEFVARALGSIGPAAKAALPTLLNWVPPSGPKAPDTVAVQEALRKISK
jgi:beta-lactamase regulating signal transducer with metallopeptidase domain/protein involved in polysaccharide export with SLBB domain